MPSKTSPASARKWSSWNKIELEPDAPKVRIIGGINTGRAGWLLAEYERIYLIWLNKDTRVFAEKCDVDVE